MEIVGSAVPCPIVPFEVDHSMGGMFLADSMKKSFMMVRENVYQLILRN